MGIEIGEGVSSSTTKRNIKLLSTLNAAIGTTVANFDPSWSSQVGDPANHYDELLFELEHGMTFHYALMPRAREMVNSKVYKPLTQGLETGNGNAGNNVVLKVLNVVFDETNPRQIRLQLRSGVALGNGTIKVWGIIYRSEAESSFSPSQANLYAAVKAILVHSGSPGAIADDGNNEIDITGGDSAPYVLPQATESIRGGVEGATQAQAQAGSGTTILAWTNNRIRQLIQAALPTVSSADASAGSSSSRRAWTALRVRQAIRAVFTSALETLVNGALQRAGGTMTGALTLVSAPTSDLQAATKKYVDDNAGGGGTGTLQARVERVNFDNISNGQSDVEMTPNALSVVNGSGSNEFLSDISGNDFTLGSGVYLVNIHAVFNFANQQASAWFGLRRASDDAALDQSNPIYVRLTTETPWSARMIVILAADTAVNLFAHRASNSAMTAVHAEFVKLSSGGAVHSAHNRYVGWAAQQTPTALEIGAGMAFTSDVLTIPNPDPDDTIDDDDTPGWLWFAVPDDAGAPSAAYFDGNTHDILGGFTRLASGTFAGHIVYVTNAEQDPDILGTGSRTITLEYS